MDHSGNNMASPTVVEKDLQQVDDTTESEDEGTPKISTTNSSLGITDKVEGNSSIPIEDSIVRVSGADGTSSRPNDDAATAIGPSSDAEQEPQPLGTVVGKDFPVLISKKTRARPGKKFGTQSKLPLNGKADNLSDDLSSPSVQASNIDLIIERSNNLCDRWHKLGLGKDTGTTALNEYIYRKGLAKNNEDPFTASEMVQTFETLRPIIKSLPPDSEIRNMMKKSDFGEGYVVRENYTAADGDINDSNNGESYKPPFPTETLAKVYELMSTQSNFQMFKRRKLHHLDGDQVIEKLKSYENRVCELELREEQVMNSFLG